MRIKEQSVDMKIDGAEPASCISPDRLNFLFEEIEKFCSREYRMSLLGRFPKNSRDRPPEFFRIA